MPNLSLQTDWIQKSGSQYFLNGGAYIIQSYFLLHRYEILEMFDGICNHK